MAPEGEGLATVPSQPVKITRGVCLIDVLPAVVKFTAAVPSTPTTKLLLVPKALRQSCFYLFSSCRFILDIVNEDRWSVVRDDSPLLLDVLSANI